MFDVPIVFFVLLFLLPFVVNKDVHTVIGTLAVDGWAVTFGTARRGLGGAAACGPSSLY